MHVDLITECSHEFICCENSFSIDWNRSTEMRRREGVKILYVFSNNWGAVQTGRVEGAAGYTYKALKSSEPRLSPARHKENIH